jgi:hypothetical protein
MRKIRVIFTTAIALGLLSGCATRANSVAPVSISSSDYNGISCGDARSQLETSRAKQNALARRQNNAALADTASVFLFLLPLGSVFGADVEGELAQSKGETLALQRYVSSSCKGQ